MMKLNLFFASILLLGVGFSLQSHAQENLLNDLVSCRSIENQEARLQCFEAGLDRALERQGREEERQAKAKIEAEELAEENFGLADEAAEKAIIETAENPEETMQAYVAVKESDELEARVTRASKNALGKWTVYLNNGQVWKETSASTFIGKIKENQTAKIERKGLDWYRMYIDGKNRPLAVKRIK